MSAANLPAARPQCPKGHSTMVLRDPRQYTSEQAWCGTWYNCPPGRDHCKSSVLLASPALLAASAVPS